MPAPIRAVGIDFGTTNSALAVIRDGGGPELVRFPVGRRSLDAMRSVLHFDPERREPSGRLVPFAGPWAVDAYLESAGAGRLIQSTKSFVASRLFLSTNVYGTVLSIETLVAYVVRELRRRAEATLGDLGRRAVVGRPVSFANAGGPEDDALAEQRLRSAFAQAGFHEVEFEYEPVAAAWHYEQAIGRDALVLIADFGGGTSDFCLVRVGPGQKGRERGESILGSAGVALAGDAFDGKIVRHLVSPHLGRGASFKSLFGRVLPVPAWIYGHLERWNHVSFLRQRRTLQLLYDLRREAVEPGPLEALVHLVEQDLGFPLHRAVEASKLALSREPSARFRFDALPSPIEATFTRRDFEAWIAEELEAVGSCVDGLLARCGAAPRDVDRVFLTGGSSLVPAVREIFATRFGAERLDQGGEFTSVARGLALAAAWRGGSAAGRR